jgi:hypothetical protein
LFWFWLAVADFPLRQKFPERQESDPIEQKKKHFGKREKENKSGRRQEKRCLIG